MTTYFTLVRLPAKTRKTQIEAAIAKAMLPFKQEYCGDPELKQYIQFIDETEALSKEWTSGTVKAVRLKDGTLCSPYDDRFIRRRPTEQTTFISWDYGDAEVVDLPVQVMYASFEEYADYFCGRDPKTGKYGTWTNPNSKWDWYRIGYKGRKDLPLRNGTYADVARIAEVDCSALDNKQEKSMQEFRKEYEQMLHGVIFPRWHGPHGAAIRLGFLQCKDKGEITEEERNAEHFSVMSCAQESEKVDVLLRITDEDIELVKESFHGLICWARLDMHGWQDWGDADEMHRAFCDSHRIWLASGNQRDWIAFLFCHY